LVNKQGDKREVALLAEGIRKIATLFHLIANGSLEPGASLFWDEPDSNMNPKLVKIIAGVLWNLVNEGIQVIIATHSLFLLRELEILSNQQPYANLSSQVFALSNSDNGVTISQGNAPEDVDTLVLLDEELEQSDRFMAL
jgi:wobble nucleotide-excising tRNase